MRTKVISTAITLSKDQRSQLLKPFKLIAQQRNYTALILTLQHPISPGVWTYTFVTSLSNPTILEYGTTTFKLAGTEKKRLASNRCTVRKNPRQREASPNRILKELRPRKFTPAEIRAKMERT